jgi:hypothetical protein
MEDQNRMSMIEEDGRWRIENGENLKKFEEVVSWPQLKASGS